MNNTKSSRRSFLKSVGTGSVVASLAGYTGNDTAENKRQQTTTSTEEESDNDTNTSGTEDTDTNEFVFLVTQVFGTLDPAKQSDYTEGFAAQNFYDPFIKTDPETFEPTGHLVTEWNVEDDGSTWVFSLREDIPHQQGGTLTADDVVYSMNRLLSIGMGQASLWADQLNAGEDIKARDEYTVEFSLNQPYGPLLASFTQFFIVDSQTVKANEVDGDFSERGDYGQEYLSSNVAGTGGYTLKNWSTGNTLEMEAFDNYWSGWPDNRFDTVRAEVIGELSTVKNKMRLGEADMTDQYMGTSTYEEMAGYSNVEVPTTPQIQIFHIPMNTQKPPLDDINVRKAIAYAFDYETAVNNIVGGGTKAAGPVPRNLFGHNDGVRESAQDLDKAKAALDAAEYTVEEINEIGLEHAVIAGIESQRQFGLLNQAGLQELGIELEINPIQWSTLTDRATQKESSPHMSNVYLSPVIPSPDNYTYFMYHPNAFGTYWSLSWYSTEELTDILNQTRRETDFDARMDLYKRAQELIVDGFPSIYVANPPYRIGLNKNVSGFRYRPPLAFEWDISQLYREGDGRAE
jgi:peptide/nickel transport system substrate-binding protein